MVVLTETLWLSRRKKIQRCWLYLLLVMVMLAGGNNGRVVASDYSRVSSSTPLLVNIRGGSSWRVPPSTTSAKTSTSTSVPRQSEDQRQEEEEDVLSSETVSAFLTRDNRNTFIARVYAILTGQLLLTVGSIYVFHIFPQLSKWMIFHPGGKVVPMLSLLISTITCAIMANSEQARRSSPLKWQLLSIFTLGECIAVGFISSLFSFRTVLNAMMSTAVATLTVTMYTFLNPNPKYDLSQWGSGLLSAGMMFVVYGAINLLSQFGILPKGFLPYNEALYSLLGATLFTIYLAYHTRLVISGKHTKYQFNEKDYVFGAMALYNDIIDIFIYLLRLLDEDR